MENVRQILKQKGSKVWTILPQATVYEALELMAAKDIGALLVMDDKQVVGLFTEREYARNVVLKGRTSKATAVSELMRRNVLYINPDDTMETCMALMTQKRIRHLPVVENGEVVGMISIGDVVKAIISDHEFIIRELERYITGGHTDSHRAVTTG